MAWFDGHLDLAFLAETGRDMHASLSDCRGRFRPASVTLASLREGGVTHCLGTIFTEGVRPGDPHAEDGPWTYPLGDADAAYRAGMRQLKLYQAWAGAGVIELMRPRGATAPQDSIAPGGPIRLGVLMECADPIGDPGEAQAWMEGGVIAVGLAWWHQGRYAGGNGTNAGLSAMGRDLVLELDRLGVVHDLTHLSQRATDELLALSDAPVIASHSNCRSLLGGDGNPDGQRHLCDGTIREIGRRGGVVGVNLVRNFLRLGLNPKDPTDRPPIDDVARHVEHVCEVMGHREGVALGSDMDGGITANDLPRGIDTPADLEKIASLLAARGWSDGEIEGFRFGNWARFWGCEAESHA